MNYSRAFTLAEVLVTLMVIGVVAAVTIPTLNQNIKSNQYVAGVLKADSVLSQAINRMKLDYGPVGLGKSWNSEADFVEGFSKQFNTVKTCSKSNCEDCYDFDKMRNLDGSKSTTFTKGPVIVSTDGMVYFVLFYGSTASSNSASTAAMYSMPEEDAKKIVARISVDVNGRKGPNQSGRDIHHFIVVKGKGVMPTGYANPDKDKNSTAYIIKHKRID